MLVSKSPELGWVLTSLLSSRSIFISAKGFQCQLSHRWYKLIQTSDKCDEVCAGRQGAFELYFWEHVWGSLGGNFDEHISMGGGEVPVVKAAPGLPKYEGFNSDGQSHSTMEGISSFGSRVRDRCEALLFMDMNISKPNEMR